MNRRQLLDCAVIKASEAPRLRSAVTKVLNKKHPGKPLLVLFFALTMLVFLMSAVHAQVINFPGGFAGARGQIWLENFASHDGSLIHLVPSTEHNGSNAWFKTPENVQAFTTTFTFHIDCSTKPSDCGGGFGFMMICACTGGNPVYDPPGKPGYTYSGFSGAQFSWSQCQQPLTPSSTWCYYNPAINTNNGSDLRQLPDNIIVTFNNYDNHPPGTPGVSLTTYARNGVFPAAPVTVENDMGPSGINLNSGDLFSATLTYNGTVLTESLTDTVTGANYTHSYPANIPAAITADTAFIGFGGGTGAALDDVYIHSWTYSVETPGQAAAPTFSPAAGVYTGTQTVTLSTLSTGAVLCYSTAGSPATDGANSCSSGTLSTGPITVSSSHTLNAVAGGTGYVDSPVSSANYSIQAVVTTPAFSPAAGTYSSAQSVTISDAISNATIYYTNDGTAPTSSSTKYAGAIAVSATEKLEAIATAAGDANSAVASAAYTISPLPAASTPTFTPGAGIYNSAQLVTISNGTTGATSYYTTDGSTPTTSSTAYTGPIAVSSTVTLRAISVATGDSNSAVASAAYTINNQLPAAPTPSFSPAAGTYDSAQSVTISDATSDATIYYTTDGSKPTTSSTEYTGPITVSSTETIHAIVVAMGDSNSGIATAAYTIHSSLPPAPRPAFSPAAGAYASTQSVTISDATSDATIYYTTNGTTPTMSSTTYSGPITVNSTETLQAIAAAAGDSNSAIASAAYTIGPAFPSIATPIFSPTAGTYNSPQSVTISDAASGAIIYYTTDGSAPTTSSSTYSGAIAVSTTETLQAIAVASGDSAVAVAAYTITAQPAFMVGTSVSSLTVNPGGQGTVMITVTPENGFKSPVVLACSGLSDWATCSFAETTVTPAGAAATTQLIISANTQSALPPGSQVFFPVTAWAMTVCFFGWRRRHAWHRWLLLAVAFAGMGSLFGCSGSSTPGGNSAAPAEATTVTITAVSGNLKGSAEIAVTVD